MEDFVPDQFYDCNDESVLMITKYIDEIEVLKKVIRDKNKHIDDLQRMVSGYGKKLTEHKLTIQNLKVELDKCKSFENKPHEEKVVYTDEHIVLAFNEGCFNRVKDNKICGKLLITDAVTTWNLFANADRVPDKLFIYNVEYRIAGYPKDVAMFFGVIMKDKPDSQMLVNSAIKESISFVNYDTTMKYKYEREVEHCKSRNKSS